MPTDIIGMYAAGTGGTQDAQAVIDIPQDGTIVGVDWDGSANMDADGEVFSAELSFIGTNQLTTNDVRGRISSISAQMSLTTSGVSNPSIQKYVGGMELQVFGGERLYLHIVATAGVGSGVLCNIHLEVGARSSVRRSSRRR